MKEKEIIDYINKHFPFNSTDKLASKLNLTPSKVRTIAKNNNIAKDKQYLNKLKNELTKNRRKWYERNIPEISPTYIQEQLILGSLLGDGYISKGANRSINYAYQEHFGENQREYREWKLNQLNGLGFCINGNYLRSRSHPYFTSLRDQLYKGSYKILTNALLKKCTHPMFVTALFLDDGTLTFNNRFNKNKRIVYCTPNISLYTLNFHKEDNKKLANHLNSNFNTNFVISSHPDGHGTLLKLNKVREVEYFLNLIEPIAKCIPSMLYKTNLHYRLDLMRNCLYQKYGNDVTIKLSSSETNKNYNFEEIDCLIKLKNNGVKDKHIAERLGRSYWSVVYKLAELRKNGRLE
ncbi:hypothetical protein [Pseudalkalibacillus sp. SCS-8]|uniref:hypothetical protein n=1 Tax=Pseudalkalibacillus nanhaiensis TaxID=3115291 RepID=UPI0032D9DAAA